MISFSSSIAYIKRIGFGTFLWRCLRTMGVLFTTAIAIIIPIAEITALDLPILQEFWFYPALLGVAFIIAFFIEWPKKFKTSFTDKDGVTVIVECCNLLKQEGLKIIHTTSSFETDPNIIFKESLHGQFLAYCSENGIDVAGMADNSIRQKKLGRDGNGCFPLGTILDFVPDADAAGQANPLDDFRFVSFADYVDGQNLAVDPKTYRRLLSKMWCNLSASRHKHDTVNVAVMGNKFVNFPKDYTIEHKVDVILQEFYAVSRNKKVCTTLRICIHPADADNFGFDYYSKIIQHIANRPEKFV